MFNRTNILIVVLAIASAGFGLAMSQWLRPAANTPVRVPTVDVLDIGDLVDDTALPDRNGSMRQLSEWRGKLIVLNFWASWCGPCREEMPMLDAMRTQYANRDVEVIGIAAEEAPAALSFLEHNPVSYPILINSPADAADFSLRLGNTQGVLPYTALIDRDGSILATRMGNFSQAALEEWIAPYL
ncbi:TlpA family protein disulfide reductase [Dokdonella sp.]|uniref:TlpA family protein disulfide reductase n=1 Tax=Dokdonella sp. TaxID=2291710 RepID=UPI003C688A4F